MNLCIFMGNLVEDPETRTVNGTKGETSVLTFRIGVNTYISKDKQEVTFPTIEAWGNSAELIAKHFAKGDLIRVFTRLQTDKYTDKESGDTKYRDKYRLDKFEFPETSKKKDVADATPAEEDSPTEKVKGNGKGKGKGKGKGGAKTPEVEVEGDDGGDIDF